MAGERKLLDLGRLSFTEPVLDEAHEQKRTIFDPIPRVDGIEPSDDPLLELRAAVYLLSGRRRRQPPNRRLKKSNHKPRSFVFSFAGGITSQQTITGNRMQIAADIRYALRQFAKAPGFTATAILTLALGIGATTAIFTLVYAVLLKSLPVVNPEDLYRVGNEENCCVNGGMQDNWTLFSYEQYKQFRGQATGFAELAAFQSGRNDDRCSPQWQQ